MNLSNYARIGKAPITKAIGLQKNHKKVTYIETKKLDREASGCFSCANNTYLELAEYCTLEQLSQCKANCANCPNAVYRTVYEEKTSYINEKNKYGYQPRLKQIALKLLFIYHFSNPDEKGLVKGLKPKELAELLGCTVRSIKNANMILQKYGYILYSEDGFSKNRFQVILSEYDTYHLSADQGGRGYATFNKECLMQLLQIKDLNQLRIFIRVALDADVNRNIEKEIHISRDFSDFRRFLPKYCKPGIIKKALSTVTEMFSIHIDDYDINFTMNPAYHGRRNFDQSNITNNSIMEEYIESLSDTISCANASIMKDSEIDKDVLSSLNDLGLSKIYVGGKIKKYLYPPLYFSTTDIDTQDLGLLCTTFGVETVKKAICHIYKEFVVKQIEIGSLGALIRNLLQESLWGHNKFNFSSAI